MVFLFLLFFASASAVDYSTVLLSPARQQHLFSIKYNVAEIPASERGFRFRLFRKELVEISRDNKVNPWESDLNQFSVMTLEEKSQYLGMNITGTELMMSDSDTEVTVGPKVKDWRTDGLVTGVKDQKKCGSCWSYAAIGPMETVYAQVTGKLKQFAEQEFVDCAYRETYDSCRGGWVTSPWDYAISSGRLATQDALPYVAKDRPCDVSSTHNGLIAAKMSDYTFTGSGEPKVISALTRSVLAAGFRVSNTFFRYSSGILKDTTCYADFRGYHAVVIVGYTPKAIIVKNSWGGSWGEKGYFNWARSHDGCNLYLYTSSVEMVVTEEVDTDPEYEPDADSDPCVITDPGCPCGTVRCDDDICRHQHMC